ncbi:6761_t:CDS:2 [Paraglomus occultum]|uniref:6761_t:CDS:1 n=1 Tax=Paraglomus occultum TaxID=144539 RepID=A0A9N8VE26_9GLOM|nr:6761_t:CDS:2 [Paraglomus occultum]
MIFSRCPRIEHFSIGDCGNVTDNGLAEIASYGKNLTGLEIILGNKISCGTLSSLANSCTKLKLLHIWDCGDLDDSAILSISTNLNDTLESLILNNPPALTDESLVQIGMRCRNLKHFGLEPHWGVTNSTLATLAENANGLESLQLSLQYASRITNEGISVLSRRLKNLKKIQIQESNTLHVNDLALTFLITEQRINLTSLHIYNCNFSDLFLDTIVKTRPPINDVCFFQLPLISDYHFIRFLAAVSDTLNSLQLSYCDNITEFSVIEGLGVYGGGLRKLSICPSGEMTAEGLKAISTGCSNLKEFYLSSTEDLPTQVVTLLLTSLRELEQLRIRDCPNIHPDDLRIIACGCPNLKEFYFGPSPYVDYAFIQEYNSNGKSRPLLIQGEG